MDHLHVSAASPAIIRVVLQEYWYNKTNCQTEQIQSIDVTVIISGAPYGCKMSDYVLLKTDGNYTLVKNRSNCEQVYGTY